MIPVRSEIVVQPPHLKQDAGQVRRLRIHLTPPSPNSTSSIYSTPPSFPSSSPINLSCSHSHSFTVFYSHVCATHCTTYILCRSSSLTCSVFLIKHCHLTPFPCVYHYSKYKSLTAFTLPDNKHTKIGDLPHLFLTALVGSNKSKHATTTIFTLGKIFVRITTSSSNLPHSSRQPTECCSRPSEFLP